MRTTVTISDELLVKAKRRAAERGMTLGRVIDAALRRDLASPDAPGERPVIPTFDEGTGLRPGVDLTSNRALHEVLDDDHGVTDLR